MGRCRLQIAHHDGDVLVENRNDDEAARFSKGSRRGGRRDVRHRLGTLIVHDDNYSGHTVRGSRHAALAPVAALGPQTAAAPGGT
jgi:hypothetical protein